MCGVRRKSGVSRMSHPQYEKRNCAVPGESHLHYEEKVVQCGECRIYCIRRKL